LRITIPVPLADAVSAESFRQGQSVSELVTAVLTEVLPDFVARRMTLDLKAASGVPDGTRGEAHVLIPEAEPPQASVS
jgi:hypothetical protein